MSKQHVQQPMKFNQQELDSRKDSARYEYLNGIYKAMEFSDGFYVYPATTVHTFGSVEQLVDFAVDAALKGQPRFTGESITSSPGFHSLRIYKPQEEMEADLAIIYQKVEVDYCVEIEAHNKTQIDLLTQQLFEQEKKKKEKKIEDENNRLLAAASKEAEDYIQSLLNKEEQE